MANRWVEKVFSFTVDAEGAVINKTFDLDKNAKLVRGILLTSDQMALLYYRGSQRIEISGDEIFPENFESKILMSGIAVPPDQKFWTLGDGVVTGNGELKIQYKDSSTFTTPWTNPYKVTITLQLEMK